MLPEQTHRLYEIKDFGVDQSGSLWMATCICGWQQDPKTPTRAEALAAHKQHIEDLRQRHRDALSS